MKKQNVLNLIKYHVERNENSFRNEAVAIARYFDSIGDYRLAEYTDIRIKPVCTSKQ